jgi:hypothetical protein
MNRSRLLLALPAATALVLAGGSPALAGGDGHENDDTYAEVISIADEADATEDASEVTVDFDYKCEGEGITATVVLEQNHGDVRYEDELKQEDDELTCDGEEQTATATLKPVDDSKDVENGKARVTVTFEDEDGEELDEKSEKVEVEGVDDNGDNGDKDNGDKDNGDKDNGGNDDNGKHDNGKDDNGKDDNDKHHHDGH